MPRLPYRAILALGIATLTLAAVPGGASAHTPAASRLQAAPVFVFPSNGQSFPLNGTMLFQVQPMSGAKGYLWSFVQGGAIMYQNLAWTGHLDGATYSIKKGSAAERRLHGGPMQVWVRALMGNGQWSGSSSVSVQLQGSGTGTQPQPTPTAQTEPQTQVLYQANWSNDMNGWSGAGWKSVGGLLVSDGSNGAPILAPYKPTTANYAIETTVRIDQVGSTYCDSTSYFTVVARFTQAGFYPSGYKWACHHLAFIDAEDTNGQAIRIATGNNAPDPGHGWHTYRVTVQDNQITLSFDGVTIATATDNRYLDAGQVGLQANKVQVSVRSFKVIAL